MESIETTKTTYRQSNVIKLNDYSRHYINVLIIHDGSEVSIRSD
ncbi:MAG: hypothetical protein QXN90_02355 [Zestosphaera sp.]